MQRIDRPTHTHTDYAGQEPTLFNVSLIQTHRFLSTLELRTDCAEAQHPRPPTPASPSRGATTARGSQDGRQPSGPPPSPARGPGRRPPGPPSPVLRILQHNMTYHISYNSTYVNNTVIQKTYRHSLGRGRRGTAAPRAGRRRSAARRGARGRAPAARRPGNIINSINIISIKHNIKHTTTTTTTTTTTNTHT